MNLWMSVTTERLLLADHSHKYRSAGGFCLWDAPEYCKYASRFFLCILEWFTEKTMCLALLGKNMLCPNKTSAVVSVFFFLLPHSLRLLASLNAIAFVSSPSWCNTGGYMFRKRFISPSSWYYYRLFLEEKEWNETRLAASLFISIYCVLPLLGQGM